MGIFLEIRDQKHLMFAEGSSDIEPTNVAIVSVIKKQGYAASNIKIFFDNFQSIWRFNADILRQRQYHEDGET